MGWPLKLINGVRVIDIVFINDSDPIDFTGSERNHSGDRIYRWGYLVARYLLQQQRPKADVMLKLLRNGDYPRYQALVRSWGTSMDQAFSQRLTQ